MSLLDEIKEVKDASGTLGDPSSIDTGTPELAESGGLGKELRLCCTIATLGRMLWNLLLAMVTISLNLLWMV